MIYEFLRKYMIYIITLLAYYLLPNVIIQDTGGAIMVILFLIPAIILISSHFHSKKMGFKWYVAVIIGLLWLPNIFIMNSSATIYVLIYGVISIIGLVLGKFSNELYL